MYKDGRPYAFIAENSNVVYFYSITDYNNGSSTTYTTADGNTCDGREIECLFYVTLDYRTPFTLTTYTTPTRTFTLPVALAQRSYLEIFGDGLFDYYNSKRNNNISDLKESIDGQTEQFYDINENIKNQTTAIEEQTQEMQDMNNFLQDENVDDTSIQITQDTTTDITANISDNIFNTLMNAFTSNSTGSVSFNLFGKDITLQGNTTSNLLTTINATVILNIINSFWYFLFAYFIYKDINKFIENIKSGDILTAKNTDTNIKANML